MSRHLVWFRTDLRVQDHSALWHACQNKDDEVYAVFIATPEQWAKHDMAPLRQRFILRRLTALAETLSALHIPLLYFEVPDFDAAANCLRQLVSREQFDAVFAHHEFGWNEQHRDAEVAELLAAQGCQFVRYFDQGMLPPGLTTKSGSPHKVYSNFRKCWLEQWRSQRPGVYAAPQRRRRPKPLLSEALPAVTTETIDDLWPVDEGVAEKRLEQFCQQRINAYHQHRDLPAVPGTSVLSPYLAAGIISARQCMLRAVAANNGKLTGGAEGVDTWINELIWRDFYIHILDSFPHVSRHQAFKQQMEHIPWRRSKKDFDAWCHGQTGIPIVDAAMRQLVQTGWMHNRLRMIVAMFLSKHLLIDWRKGEQFFMQHLIDGHLAANNGGWQWAASTGTDAVPYFRIFNPVVQSERFDKDGLFIKQYVPELSELNGKDIHLPKAQLRESLAPDYPAPIVDLKAARQPLLSHNF